MFAFFVLVLFSLICGLVSLNSLFCMSDLQVVVKKKKNCLRGLLLHFVFYRDVSSLTNLPASITHRFKVWIITLFAPVIKMQDEPTASCRGKDTNRIPTTCLRCAFVDQIRHIFQSNIFSVSLPSNSVT